MLFIPGLVIYLFTIAFTTNSYWKSIYLFYPPTIVIIFLSYFISKYTIREWIHKKLINKWYFNMYFD